MPLAIDRRRRGAVDWTAQPLRHPSFSPDIYIGSDNLAHVDTRRGIDGVYFLSAAPHSYNGPLPTSRYSVDEVKQYVTDFATDRAKVRAEFDTEEVENAIDEALDQVAALVEAEATVEDDLSVLDDTVEGDDSELGNILASQTRTWRTILKRRERTAIQQTQASLTYLLSNSDAWQTHLLINATIRKIIRGLEGKSTSKRRKERYLTDPPAVSLFILRDSYYGSNPITCAHPHCPLPSHSISTAGTAYLSLETVAPDAFPSLLTTAGIQVADDVYIPIYIRPQRNPEASTEPDYGPPSSTAGAGEHDDDAAAAVTVHATLCISCVRDLYACAVAPALPQPPATGPASAIDTSSPSPSRRSDPHAGGLAPCHDRSPADQMNRERNEKLVRETLSPIRQPSIEVNGGGVEQGVWPPRRPRHDVVDAGLEDSQLDGVVYGSGGGGKGQGSGTASGGVGCVTM
ncbi:hypothetical protein SLS56_005086 [Neofusicoccum ribis]|uniref:Uncharacterized protein n=1 Tax=Neofusicoccum ribis TaxID=45134 RepID=A0ABR3SUN5_9PEZI